MKIEKERLRRLDPFKNIGDRKITYRTYHCAQCAKEFKKAVSTTKEISGQTNFFCSRICYHTWRKGQFTGRDAPWFKEKSSKRASGERERNRKIALERDGCCVKCGSIEYLEVHHIDGWDPDDPNTHDVDRLMTVCHKCHFEEHKKIIWSDPDKVSAISAKIWQSRRFGKPENPEKKYNRKSSWQVRKEKLEAKYNEG